MTLIERAEITGRRDAIDAVVLYKRYGLFEVAYETHRGSTYEHSEFRSLDDARTEFAARVAAQ